jgi:SAM-dependent methyltransferase
MSGLTPILCPVCGSANLRDLYPDTLGKELPSFDYAFTPHHGKTYRILRCRDCTHAFGVVPHENLWKKYESVIDSAYIDRQEERYLTFSLVLDQLKRYLSSGRLLDVGCATGDFLQAAQGLYLAEGLELSQWSTDIARKRGFIVHNCRLQELSGDSVYDLITMWGVIEHLEMPREEVGQMYRLLKPGGLVALWTGDSASWIARLLGRKWWYIQGQHIQLFSQRSLNRLFTECGFELVSLTRYPFRTNFHFLSRSLGRYRFLGKISRYILDNRFLAEKKITLHLPGEMFAIFRKRT